MTTFLIEYKSPRRIAISKRTGKKGQSRKYILRENQRRPKEICEMSYSSCLSSTLQKLGYVCQILTLCRKLIKDSPSPSQLHYLCRMEGNYECKWLIYVNILTVDRLDIFCQCTKNVGEECL